MAPIRVRFAPSPTGSMHLGSLRTALYNYMLARSSLDDKSRFILRIEDTDQQRLVPGAVEGLSRDLEWLGIAPDEGPKQNGPFGPYIQSKRLSLYRRYANLLLEKSAAYRCFCSERTLDLVRKEALRRREVPRYDNRCRSLTPSEIANRCQAGEEYVIRFKLRDFSESWHDIIFGDIHHNVAEVEGDPIILKRDGYPTYHLANVVDDYEMQISHVLRGAEWQTSTPKHLLMFEAFGWKPPEYAHLPLLLNKDGTKLSKRQNDLSVASLRSTGFYPQALSCFVLQMGGHFADSVSDCLDLPTLAKRTFKLENIGSQFARVDFDRLYDLNRDMVRLKLKSNTEEVVSEAINIIKSHFGPLANFEESSIDRVFLANILTVYFKNRLRCLSDLLAAEYKFIWLKPTTTPNQANSSTLVPHKSHLCDLMLSSFHQKDGFSSLSSRLRSFSKENSIEFSLLMRELRIALTDQPIGLPVGEVIQILGAERTKQRLASYWQ